MNIKLKLLISWIINTLIFLVIGLLIPVAADIEMPLILLFTWVVSPLAAIIVNKKVFERWKLDKASLCLNISFAINLIIVGIYTCFELKSQHTGNDFLDFAGLVFLAFGIGQAVGLIFEFLIQMVGRDVISGK